MLVTVLALATSIASARGPVRPAPARPAAPASALVRGANRFAFALYARLAARPGNLFFSPASIHDALAMVYAGARGATEREMAATLHYPAGAGGLGRLEHDLTAEFRKRPPRSGKPFELTLANALWGTKGADFNAGFVFGLWRDYGVPLRRVDFVAPGAREEINGWAARATHDRIRDIVPPGVLDASTRLVLANAIYFRGTWEREFKHFATHPGPFRLGPRDSIDVPMMFQEEPFDYAENRDLQLLRLPYADGRTSMVVLLPRRVDGLAALERRLDATYLAERLAAASRQEVRVVLPRFRFADDFELSRTLVAMGMARAFDPNAADLGGMSSRERLYLSKVFHKAFVTVDEQGTEAAAATAAVVKVGFTMERPPLFRADHPFLFLIRHDPTGAILFLGRVVDPR